MTPMSADRCQTCGSERPEVRDVKPCGACHDSGINSAGMDCAEPGCGSAPCDNDAFHGRCDHKFVDSNHCLKCGWVPPHDPVKTAHEAINRLGMDTWDRTEAHAALDAAVKDAKHKSDHGEENVCAHCARIGAADAVQGMHAIGCGCHSLNGTESHERMAWQHSQHEHPFVDPRCLAARQEATDGKW